MASYALKLHYDPTLNISHNTLKGLTILYVQKKIKKYLRFSQDLGQKSRLLADFGQLRAPPYQKIGKIFFSRISHNIFSPFLNTCWRLKFNSYKPFFLYLGQKNVILDGNILKRGNIPVWFCVLERRTGSGFGRLKLVETSCSFWIASQSSLLLLVNFWRAAILFSEEGRGCCEFNLARSWPTRYVREATLLPWLLTNSRGDYS